MVGTPPKQQNVRQIGRSNNRKTIGNKPMILKTSILICLMVALCVFLSGLNYAMMGKISSSSLFEEEQSEMPDLHKIAGLNCDPWGGPPNEIAEEMVYWQDIPSDAHYVSPFREPGVTKYLTFEPDRAGWNNIRMGMETVIALAHAMGRTLVLPPDREIWAMNQGKEQKKSFSFDEFYHLESLAIEHPGLDIITMEEFLEVVAMEQKRFTHVNPETQKAEPFYPPENRTQWDGERLEPLWDYLRSPEVSLIRKWDPDQCIAAFPASKDPKDIDSLQETLYKVRKLSPSGSKLSYIGNPTPVNASTHDRMAELIGRRENLCLYDKEMQDAFLIHFKEDYRDGFRLLTHFYGFMFFQDWTHDLWTKRFVRDHVRYNDEIVCAAARVVNEIRSIARNTTVGLRASANTKGDFHTMHVRRNDFSNQYKEFVLDAPQIVENSKEELKPGITLFIATDERDSSYFDPFREQYNVLLLKDFSHVLTKVNSNLYPLIDQLVASRGKTFHGVFLSTFTGYINRLRGYYSTKERLPGYKDGIIESYHFVRPADKLLYKSYHPFENPSFMREYPICWRDIDQGIDVLAHPPTSDVKRHS